jgi:hypothetical protein
MAAAERDNAIELDFTGCIFLHQHAVAFLGGLIRTLQRRGCTVGADSVPSTQPYSRTSRRTAS